ncbi:hypothetical protein G7Y89_g8982 [Cudoniella acicularis]|uniref:Uncharacterized protein n=1 Tax=Cudoniella acicularis TaxID=354080 RepID=A0A8H4RFJ0_9HELO|nr:hypothetical protein G7Y89_g8982 [Cudoniella acicularis]
MSLHVLLNYTSDEAPKGAAFGGYIDMSGWLPCAADLYDTVWSPSLQDDDPFSTSERTKLPQERVDLHVRQISAANFIRDIIDHPPLENNHSPPFVRTPILLVHGERDEIVRMKLGEQARDIMAKLELNVK